LVLAVLFLLFRGAFAMGRTETTIEPPDVRVQMSWGDTPNLLLDIEGWMPSEIEAVTPLVDELMRLVEGSHCLPGSEVPVELALREALYNAVIHGNRLDPAKLVQVRCRCERDRGLDIVVKDQGQGFDVDALPHPLAAENLQAGQGRGILLMRYWMDEVWFEQGGAEVHMRKGTLTCTGTISQDENKTSHYCRAERDAGRVPDEGKLFKPVGTGENETC
jgi:serine/threonine-protein kinase RsbW